MPLVDRIKDWLYPEVRPQPGGTLEAGPATVTFHLDGRPKVQPFTVLKDFFCEELRSQYCAGSHYNAREGDVTLLRLLPEWKVAGKVSY